MKENIPQAISIPTMHFIDFDGKPTYDFEEMAREFQKELSKLDDSITIIVSIDFI